jgi:TP901 family phage tail tape measure protein
MAQEVGSLKVNLSLDSANFTQSMQDVNRKLKNLNSDMKVITSTGDRFGSSTDQLRLKQRNLSDAMTLHRSKVEALREQYEKSVQTKGADARATENLATRYNSALAAMNRTENELTDINRSLEQQTNQWNVLGRSLNDVGDRMRRVGSSMSNVGRDMSMRVTAPIVGLGAATVKTAADFEESMSKVAAISGATGSEFEALEAQAKELGATTKYSASEASEGMAFLAQAGFKTNEIMAAMPGLLDLAAAGALDLGRASDIASNIMSGFTIDANKAGHVSDVLAKAASSANTNVEQLGEAMKYLAPVSNSLGWSLEEATSAVMALSDAGIQGEQAGAAFSTSLTRLTSPSKEAAGVIKDLGIEFFTAEGNMKTLPAVIAELEKGTKGLTQEQKAASISTIVGMEAYKSWAVLLEKGSGELATNTTMLENADGAAKKMAETMSENVKGGFKEMMSALEGLAIQLGDILLPVMNDIIKKITEWTREFGELSPEMQKTILAIAGIAAAIGPLLLAAGTMISSIGTIAKVFGTASLAIAEAGGVSAALGGVLTTLTGPIGLTIAAVAALGAGAVMLAKHMKKPAFEVELFGDQVSESSKKAVGSYLKLDEKARAALDSLSWGQRVVTEEMANEIVATFDEMGNRILEEMKVDHEEQLAEAESFFLSNSVLTADEEAKALEKLKKSQEEKRLSVEDGQKRIQDILNNAVEEHRQTTDNERAIINSIREQMKADAVTVLTESQVEQQAIYEQMKAQASEISAEHAAEVVENSIKQKDEVVKEAEDQYNKQIAFIIALRDESGAITSEQADQMIADATKQKDEVVARAEEMHGKVVSEAKAQAGEHVAEVNWETGQIMTKWEQLMKASSTIWGIIGKNIKTELTDIGVSMSTKMATAKVNFENGLDNMRVAAALKLAEIKAKFENFKDDLISFFANLVLKIPTPHMPKLPHFSLSTSSKEVMGKTLTYPTGFDVDWYDKGGIFTGPSIIGVGEKRPEFVGALEDLRLIVREEFNKTTSNDIGQRNEKQLSIQPSQVVLDKKILGEIVFEVIDDLNRQKEDRLRRFGGDPLGT